MEASPELIDWILSEMTSGQSQAEIARTLGVPPSRIYAWLGASDEVKERSARAREASAEAWLDRGLSAIESSLAKAGPIDASAARAYAQECARRAAIRNPKYRDKQDHTLAAPDGGPVAMFARVEYVVIDPKAPDNAPGD